MHPLVSEQEVDFRGWNNWVIPNISEFEPTKDAGVIGPPMIAENEKMVNSIANKVLESEDTWEFYTWKRSISKNLKRMEAIFQS